MFADLVGVEVQLDVVQQVGECVEALVDGVTAAFDDAVGVERDGVPAPGGDRVLVVGCVRYGAERCTGVYRQKAAALALSSQQWWGVSGTCHGDLGVGRVVDADDHGGEAPSRSATATARRQLGGPVLLANRGLLSMRERSR